jgi:DNA polymerase I-like protein with 3'-5' exonuclease and polymerase domains
MTDQVSAITDTEFEKELAALARMVTHARQSANELRITMPVYCLDMALASILEEMELHGIDLKKVTCSDKNAAMH